jgi:hypothetical protein
MLASWTLYYVSGSDSELQCPEKRNPFWFDSQELRLPMRLGQGLPFPLRVLDSLYCKDTARLIGLPMEHLHPMIKPVTFCVNGDRDLLAIVAAFRVWGGWRFEPHALYEAPGAALLQGTQGNLLQCTDDLHVFRTNDRVALARPVLLPAGDIWLDTNLEENDRIAGLHSCESELMEHRMPCVGWLCRSAQREIAFFFSRLGRGVPASPLPAKPCQGL